MFRKSSGNRTFRSIAPARSFPIVGQVVGHGGMASTYWSNKGATLPHGLTQISLHLLLCKRSTIPPAPFYCPHSIPKPVFFLTDCLLTAPRNTSGPAQILRRCKQKEQENSTGLSISNSRAPYGARLPLNEDDRITGIPAFFSYVSDAVSSRPSLSSTAARWQSCPTQSGPQPPPPHR